MARSRSRAPTSWATPTRTRRTPRTIWPRRLTWFNEAQYYTVAPNGSLPGNERSGAIRGPGYQVWNLDMFKNIAINERSHLQLRVEAFNVWNHTNFTAVQTLLNNADAGQVTAARDPRLMQLGVKYIF